jgi:hypothetical protein
VIVGFACVAAAVIHIRGPRFPASNPLRRPCLRAEDSQGSAGPASKHEPRSGSRNAIISTLNGMESVAGSHSR